MGRKHVHGAQQERALVLMRSVLLRGSLAPAGCLRRCHPCLVAVAGEGGAWRCTGLLQQRGPLVGDAQTAVRSECAWLGDACKGCPAASCFCCVAAAVTLLKLQQAGIVFSVAVIGHLFQHVSFLVPCCTSLMCLARPSLFPCLGGHGVSLVISISARCCSACMAEMPRLSPCVGVHWVAAGVLAGQVYPCCSRQSTNHAVRMIRVWQHSVRNVRMV